ALVVAAELEALEQRAGLEAEAAAQLAQGVDAGREAAVLDAANGVGGHSAALGEDVLGDPAGAPEAADVLAELPGVLVHGGAAATSVRPAGRSRRPAARGAGP